MGERASRNVKIAATVDCGGEPARKFAAVGTEARDTISDAVAALCEQDVERLLFRLSPAVRRQKRLDRRDAMIRELAASRYSDLPKGVAAAIERDLKNFEARGYRRTSALDDASQSLMRRILDAGDLARRVPKKRAILNILAGHRTPHAQ